MATYRHREKSKTISTEGGRRRGRGKGREERANLPSFPSGVKSARKTQFAEHFLTAPSAEVVHSSVAVVQVSHRVESS